MESSPRKAISPLISTVLLIVFAVAIATTLIAWGGGYIKQNTEKAQQKSQSALDCAGIGVDVLRAFSDASEQTLGSRKITRIDVKSTGQNPATVTEIIVSSTAGDLCNFAQNETTIAPADIRSFIETCSVTCSNLESIHVKTTCGDVQDLVLGSSSIIGCQ